MQVWGGCNFCLCALTLIMCTFMRVSDPFVHTFTRDCMSLCICAVWHTAVLSAWLNIFSVHSPLLFLSSSRSPSPQPRSARLARTCMSVDSVLCLLPWHAPTSLQCSPVCINWQRDSGYVVCGVDWKEREEGRVKKQEAIQGHNSHNKWWTERWTSSVHRGTDRQTNKQNVYGCVSADITWICVGVCVCVCKRAMRESVYMSVCISVFADLCLLRLTVLFVCAHSCVSICAVQISHCRGKAL